MRSFCRKLAACWISADPFFFFFFFWHWKKSVFMRLGWVIKILEDGRLILARAASVGISRRRSANNFFFFLFSNDCQGAAKFKSRRQEATTTKHKNISRGNTTNLQTHTPAAGECFFSFGEGIYYSRTLPRASIIKIRRKTKQNF